MPCSASVMHVLRDLSSQGISWWSNQVCALRAQNAQVADVVLLPPLAGTANARTTGKSTANTHAELLAAQMFPPCCLHDISQTCYGNNVGASALLSHRHQQGFQSMQGHANLPADCEPGRAMLWKLSKTSAQRRQSCQACSCCKLELLSNVLSAGRSLAAGWHPGCALPHVLWSRQTGARCLPKLNRVTG